jgi:endonuclease-3 related protein
MASLRSEFDAVSEALARAFGSEPPSSAEPVEPFRALLRHVLLTQRGLRVDQAIEAIDRAGWSEDLEALCAVDPQELTDLLRDPRGTVPAGVVPLILRIASWVNRHGGMEALATIDTESLRDELRSIRGVGPTTASQVLLEVFRRPTFPISRSDYRVLIRHGWIDPGADETEAREVVEGAAPDDPDAMLRVASWFESLGRYCKASAPRCDRCPLQPFLPEGGPLDPE